MAAIVGWFIIGAVAYVLGVYTTTFDRARYAAATAGGGAKRHITLNRLLGVGGFVGGVAVGGKVIAIVAGVLGGILGGFAGFAFLSGLDLSTVEIIAAGGIAFAVFAVLAWGGEEEDDD